METLSIFERNIQAVKNKINLDNIKSVEEKINYFAENHTSSGYSFPDFSEEQIAECAKAYDTNQMNRIIIFLGLSDGRLIGNALGCIDDTCKILIVEPETSVIFAAMKEIDYSEILADDRVILLLEGINMNALHALLQCVVDYTNKNNVSMTTLPGYEKYQALREDIGAILAAIYKREIANKNTDLVIAESTRENILKNMPNAIMQHSLNQLVKTMIQIDKEGYPAIIVSAGPSLDNNVEQLRKVQNRAFVIAVDTAMKTLLRHEIMPDILVCIDSRKVPQFFEHEDFKNIPLLLDVEAPPFVVEKHSDSNYYIVSSYNALNCYANVLTGDAYGEAKQGGSVAHTAMSTAVMMGFKNIILVGQDLAFTGDKLHTKDAYDDEELNKKHAQNNAFETWVEGVDGSRVRTDQSMVIFREWIENLIASKPDVHFIDATEGGALIHGTEILSLESAIGRECRTEHGEVAEVIANIPTLFTEEQQEMIFAELRNFEQIVDNLKIQLNYGIKAYNALRIALENNDNAKAQEAMQIVSKVNEMEDTNPIMPMVEKYIIKEKYEIRSQLYDTGDESIENTIDGAIKLLEAYILGIDEFKKDIPLLTGQLV